MSALLRAAREGKTGGNLFWCVRGSGALPPYVMNLLRAYGTRGYVVRVDSFDDLMTEVERSFRLQPGRAEGEDQRALGLLVSLAEDLADPRRAENTRDRRRNRLTALAKLLGTTGAAIVAKDARGAWRVDATVNVSTEEPLAWEGRLLRGTLANKMNGRTTKLRIANSQAKKEPFFRELSNTHTVHLIPVQFGTAKGFLAFTFEGDFDALLVEFRVLRAAATLLIRLADGH